MSELDKTIEELEAEVKLELEEAATADAPKKGSAKGDSMEKVDGEVQDLGPAVVDPEAKTSGPSKADDKVKKDSSAPTKGAKPAETAEKVKEDAETEDGEDLSEARATKAEMLQAMYSKMEGMKAGDLKAAYEKMMGDDEEDEEDEDEMEVSEETLEDRLASVDVSEDVAALTEGEELSEDFQSKAATIFEAAVKSKLRSEVSRIESAKAQEVAEEVEIAKSELTEKVDAYLNYVVEEWMSENELAVERGLKGEIAEDFISGLKSLFEEHYIDVPDEKYDILGAQAEKLDELEDKLNEQIEKNATLKTQVGELMRESVFAEIAEELTATEVEKFKGLSEDVEFKTEEDFREKLSTLKESYFPSIKPVTESVDAEVTGGSLMEDSSMAAYLSAISKNVK